MHTVTGLTIIVYNVIFYFLDSNLDLNNYVICCDGPNFTSIWLIAFSLICLIQIQLDTTTSLIYGLNLFSNILEKSLYFVLNNEIPI